MKKYGRKLVVAAVGINLCVLLADIILIYEEGTGIFVSVESV